MLQRGIIGGNFHQTGSTNVALGRDQQWRAGLRSPIYAFEVDFRFCASGFGLIDGANFSRNHPGYSHRCVGRGNFRCQRDGEECGHRPGAQHADQRRRQLQRARIADRQLYRHHLAKRFSNLGDHQCGGGRGQRAPGGCFAAGGPGFADGGGLGRGPVPGRYHFGPVGRNADPGDDCQSAGQWARLHQADLSEPRRCRVA